MEMEQKTRQVLFRQNTTNFPLLEDYILKVKYLLFYEKVVCSTPTLSVKSYRVLLTPPFIQKSNPTS